MIIPSKLQHWGIITICKVIVKIWFSMIPFELRSPLLWRPTVKLILSQEIDVFKRSGENAIFGSHDLKASPLSWSFTLFLLAIGISSSMISFLFDVLWILLKFNEWIMTLCHFWANMSKSLVISFSDIVLLA